MTWKWSACRLEYSLEHKAYVIEYLFIFESDDSKSFLLKRLGAKLILFGETVMNATINFNYKTKFRATEIGD